MKHIKTLSTRDLKESMKKGRMWRMPDILPVCMQDVLHGRKSELREDEIGSLKRTTEDGSYKQR